VHIFIEENNGRDGQVLDDLNSKQCLNLKPILQSLNVIDPEFDPIAYQSTVSEYHDVDSFVNEYAKSNKPFILSINVQSINAKLSKLSEMLTTLSNKGIHVDIVAMQELWKIQYDSLITVPGYQRLVYKSRRNGKGGGVGFFIKEGTNYKILTPPFQYFEDKVFESLTIEVSDKSNSKGIPYIVSNIYRSPTAIHNMTPTEQSNTFLDRFDSMLTYLNTQKYKSYVCLDSNINLLDIQTNPVPLTYYNTATSNGFLLTNYGPLEYKKTTTH
jgi:exonuclease III